MENVLTQGYPQGNQCPACGKYLTLHYRVFGQFRCGECDFVWERTVREEEQRVIFWMDPFQCPSCEKILLVDQMTQTIPADDADAIHMVLGRILVVDDRMSSFYTEVTTRSEVADAALKLNEMVNDLVLGDQVVCANQIDAHDEDDRCVNPKRAREEVAIPRERLRKAFRDALQVYLRGALRDTSLGVMIKEGEVDWGEIWEKLECEPCDPDVIA